MGKLKTSVTMGGNNSGNKGQNDTWRVTGKPASESKRKGGGAQEDSAKSLTGTRTIRNAITNGDLNIIESPYTLKDYPH